MADKVQNITINYKFNTAEIDKANQSLNQANAASNKLQQAGQKAGSSISQEFQKSQKTILDMQTALTRLKSVIEVTSNPAKLKQLSAEYRNIKTQLDAATKSAFGFNKAVQDSGSSFQKVSGQLGGLINGVKAVFGAAIVRQVADVTLEMARLAGNTEGVKRAFERAFPDSVGLMNRLQAATQGTVSEFELMQRTLQATNLGVAVEELPVLFEFAAARAQQTGESVDYLVDSIVRGIGRKSPLILDNLGLSAVRLKEKFDGVALASLSVAEVTRGVGEIAREELDKMGGFVATASTTVDQMNVAWTRLKTNLASRIDSSNIVAFFRDAFNGAANLLRTDKEIQAELVKQRASTELASLKENQLNAQRAGSQQELVNRIQDEIRSRMALIDGSRIELAILKEKYDQHNNTGNATGKIVEDARKAREEISKQGVAVSKNLFFYQETIRLLKAYQTEIAKNTQAEERGGIIERKKEEIKLIQQQIDETNNLADLGVGGRLIKKLEIAQAELGDLMRAFTSFKIPEFKTEITDAAQTLSNFESASERIRNQLLQIADTGVTITPTAPKSFYTPDNWQKLKDDFVENWRDITSAGIDIQADQFKSLADVELTNMKERLNNIKEFYDNQQALAGDNERAKEQLRIREERETKKIREEIARKEKQVRRTQVVIDIAAGIAKAFATYPWPYSLIPAAFVAAQGASQLAIINRQPTNFAKGVIDLKGPGTATSDSIPANLSRGESVMTAWETKHAGDVLRDIRAKKLDNDKLREMKQGRAPMASPAMDANGIIKAIKEQKPPDVELISNLVYKSKKYNDEYKKRVRSSSMGI